MLSRRSLLAAAALLPGAALATSRSVDITVVHGGRGPSPLPSPYPLQPGYTLISSLSEITGPGNYQLSADLGEVSIPPDVTIDAAGHNLGNVWFSAGTTLKNATIMGAVQIIYDGVTLFNSTIYCPSSTSVAYVVLVGGNNISLINNSISGDYFGYSSGTDDVVLLVSSGSTTLTNFQAINNVIQGCYDMGIEGEGHFDQCRFQDNSFNTVGGCIGGWYDAYRGGDFRLSDSVFQGNLAQKSSVTSLFNIAYNNVYDDSTATQMWGQSATVNGRVHDNTFNSDGWN
jgi:hypothetical protein